jgi:hypothetical protein
MNLPSIPPPPDAKSKWMGRALKASLIALPLAILIFFDVNSAIKAQRKAAASQAGWQGMKSVGRELDDEQKKNFDPKIGITNVDLAKFEKMQEGIRKVSQNSSGDEAIVAQALSHYLDRMQTAVKSYQDAAGKLRAAHVLDQFDPSDTAQIPERREIVQHFLVANAAVEQVLTNCEDGFRADLTAAKVRDLNIQDFLDTLHSKIAVKNAILLKIRLCDNRIGTAMLDALNTLESERGHWKYDPTTNKIRFETAAATEAYENAVVAIEATSEEQLKLQAQLINLPTQP